MGLRKIHKVVSDICVNLGADHHIDVEMDSTLPQAHDFTWSFLPEEGYHLSGAFIVALWDDRITCSIEKDGELKTLDQRTNYLLDALSGKYLSDDIIINLDDEDLESKIKSALNKAVLSFCH